MNYVKEIYTGSGDRLNSVQFARIDNLAYFIVHDFDNNCDICYNLRLSKYEMPRFTGRSCKIVDLKSIWEFPFKLRYYVFGIERNFIFSLNIAQASVVKYLALDKKFCFNIHRYKPLISNDDLSYSFSAIKCLHSILYSSGVSNLDHNYFSVHYSKHIYFVFRISNLDRFKLAITKYKIKHPDDTVIVNFS